MPPVRSSATPLPSRPHPTVVTRALALALLLAGSAPLAAQDLFVAPTFANVHVRRLLVAFFFSAVAGAVPAVLVIYVAEYIIGTPQWWKDSIPGWLPTWS